MADTTHVKKMKIVLILFDVQEMIQDVCIFYKDI